ncbi:hypothetical protein [Salinibacter sp.]|uniref:hypothetical protein n=1 Tax=Salinibacter sp. TaxID=2065818 RepID=UPI0021E999DA|nr:hypothetical protein [Salinibacter sp.]
MLPGTVLSDHGGAGVKGIKPPKVQHDPEEHAEDRLDRMPVIYFEVGIAHDAIRPVNAIAANFWPGEVETLVSPDGL